MFSPSSIDAAEKGFLQNDGIAVSITLPRACHTLDQARELPGRMQPPGILSAPAMYPPPKQLPLQESRLPSKPVPRKVSSWIRLQLWFNTYR